MSRKLRHRSHHHATPGGEAHDHTSEPDHELEQLAYEYWQERGSPEGSPEVDWHKAEAELERREEAASKL